MHAFLFIGQEVPANQTAISGLAKKLHAKIMDFPLVKIDDVRSLNNLIRLSFDVPTLIVCRNIHEAGEAALNAFLKNLEEPQPNIFFALTAPSARKVIPTIVSRCEIVRIRNQESKVPGKDGEEFTKMTTGEKLAYTDKIKNRDRAIELAENLVNFYHAAIHSDRNRRIGNFDILARNAEVAGVTLSRLKKNGNVNLQLTNLVISLV